MGRLMVDGVCFPLAHTLWINHGLRKIICYKYVL